MTTATFLASKRLSKGPHFRKSIAIAILWPFAKTLSNGKVFFIASFVCLVSLVALYIYQVNLITREYYLMNYYEQKVTEMSQENRDLQTKFAGAGVMKDIYQKIENLEFDSQGQVKYLKIFEGTLAAAR